MNLAKIKRIYTEYKKVIENYIFMTSLQMFNSFFFLLIYPYVISKLGVEQYGTYVFVTSITAIFSVFVIFGFELPALKVVSQNQNNREKKQEIFSQVFFAKCYLFLLSLIILLPVVLFLPASLVEQKEIVLINYLQVLSVIFLPLWYYQGMQKIKVITFIQIAIKLLSLPFIYLYVTSTDDLAMFSWIMSMTTLISALVAFFIVIYVDKLKIVFQSIQDIMPITKEGTPFLLTNIISNIKEQGIVWVLGTFFSMREVAVYDLALKIVMIPRILFMKVNSAIFPKLINEISVTKVKKLIKAEFLIGIVAVILIALFGHWLVDIMGKGQMSDAYLMSIVLGITVTSWLVVGCYISFVFLPQNKTYLVTRNQLYAFLSLWISLAIGLLIYKNIMVVAIAIAISAIIEILYCQYITSKLKLLHE